MVAVVILFQYCREATNTIQWVNYKCRTQTKGTFLTAQICRKSEKHFVACCYHLGKYQYRWVFHSLFFYQVLHGNLNSFLQLNSLQPLAPTYILINPLLLGAPLLCSRLKCSATFSPTHVIFTLLLCVLLTWRFFPVLHFHHPLTEFDHGHADRCILSLDLKFTLRTMGLLLLEGQHTSA